MRAAVLQILGAAAITVAFGLHFGLELGIAAGGACLLGFGIWDELSS